MVTGGRRQNLYLDHQVRRFWAVNDNDEAAHNDYKHAGCHLKTCLKHVTVDWQNSFPVEGKTELQV